MKAYYNDIAQSTSYPTTELIRSYYKKYIPEAKKDRTGLFLLPSQTGSGKTHATVEHIAKSIKTGREDRYIYIVNTKANLEDTYKKLLERLPEDKHHQVLFLKNNSDYLIDTFRTIISSNHQFQYLDELESYTKLKKTVETVLNNKLYNNDEFIQETIRAHSNHLKNDLSKIYRKKLLENSSTEYIESQFVEEVSVLYPTVDLDKYSAIFMTTQKFFWPVFKLKGYATLNTDESMKNAILFMDEFDAQKQVVLNAVIKDENNISYEPLSIFRNIRNALTTKEFSKKHGIKPGIIESILKYCDATYEKYNMKYEFRYGFSSGHQQETMLMDASLSQLVNAKEKDGKIHFSTKDETNHIGEKGEVYLKEMLKDVQVTLRMFIGLCKQLVRQEIKAVQKRNTKEGRVTEEQHEVLDRMTHDLIKELGYISSDTHYRYLSKMIKQDVFTKQKDFKSNRDELYENGFKLVNIKQQSYQSKTNDFELLELTHSPEKFLVDTCKHMFVVGISATATIESLMKNFDLEYVRSKTDVLTLGCDEIQQMDTLYVKAKNQENREIHTEFVQTYQK